MKGALAHLDANEIRGSFVRFKSGLNRKLNKLFNFANGFDLPFATRGFLLFS
jgi:hypothetical protein